MTFLYQVAGNAIIHFKKINCFYEELNLCYLSIAFY